MRISGELTADGGDPQNTTTRRRERESEWWEREEGAEGRSVLPLNRRGMLEGGEGGGVLRGGED